MSTTIDQKVVEMQFDNKQFENNVKTSMTTLEKLKQSLNMTGVTKGLENVSSAAKSLDMSGFSGAVETIRTRFSTLEVMAITTLANITNSAVNAGKQIVSALTLDPIKLGFEEYETQINAVQTILANTSSKGTTLTQVNDALDELNHYADMTIYNFTEMTRNIGTFTAAGVDLDTSVAAIKGIANLAAVSGSTSMQASTAMYQLSQALASGTVKLQDWNSVVNAGMGGQVFQDALKETARIHGVAIDQMIKSEGSFRETLSNGWLTSEILTETLSKFTGDLNEEQLRTMGYTEEQIESIIEMGQTANDAATKVKTFTQLFDTLKEAAQSGWTQSWEIIVGDFEEAKELLTSVSDTFSGLLNASAEARNEVLQGWKDLGGRTAVIEAVKNAFEGVISIVKPIKEAFREIFPSITAEQLTAFSEALRDLTAKMTISEETSAKLKSTFKGMFAVIDIVRQAFSAVLQAISPLFGGLDDLGSGVLTVTGSIGDWLTSLNDFIRKNDVFGKAIQNAIGFVKKAITAIQDFAQAVKEKWNLPDISTIIEAVKEFLQTIKEKFQAPGLEILHDILERIQTRLEQVKDVAGTMKSGVQTAFDSMGKILSNCKFVTVLEGIWTVVKAIASGIGTILGALTGTLLDKLGTADFSGILDLLTGLSIGGVSLGIIDFLKGITEPFKEAGDVLSSITNILDEVGGCFKAFQEQLKAGTLLKIASAIAILAASIVVLSLIDSDKLSASLGAITMLFTDLIASLTVLGKVSGSITGTTKVMSSMIAMSVAVLILASAMKKLAELDWEGVAKGLISITSLSAVIVASAKIMSSGSGQLVKGATSLVIFASAIKILASVCRDFGEMAWSEIGKGLTGIGALLAATAIFLNTAKFSRKTLATATGIMILAAAMKVLASACRDFGGMSWSEICKGLVGVGALLAELTLFTNLTGNAKHVISTGTALVLIAASMKIFASAISDFGDLSWTEIGKGLTAMGIALGEVAVATKLMPKNMVSVGTGLVIVGAAMEIMADVLSKMGSMSWESIAKGLVSMGGAIAELAIGLKLMNGTLAGSAAMLVAAASLAILTPVLLALGSMSWESIAKGLVALAGAFVVIGVAGAVLSPILPAILGLAGAFALIGVGVLAIGAGLIAVGAGLSAIAVGFGAMGTAGTAGAIALVAAISIIVTGITELLPIIVRKLGDMIVAFCDVIVECTPAIGEAIKAFVLTLVDVIVECVPEIVEGLLVLVEEILGSLAKHTPKIVESLFEFLIGLLEGVANKLPDLIVAAMDVIMAFFSGVVDALKGIDTSTLLQGIVGIGLIAALMVALSAITSFIPGAMLGVLGIGAVIAELALVLAAIGGLAQIPGLSWLIDEGGVFLEKVGNAIGSFAGGIIGGFMSGVSSQFPQIGSDLSAFMTNVQPFIDGASKIDASTMNGVNMLANTIMTLTKAEILDGLASWLTGGSSLADFGKELAAFGPCFSKYYESIQNVDGSVVESSANAAMALTEFAKEIPNSGGLAGWFAGENSLAVFAQELAEFGPSLKFYADSVSGLDANVVVNSANAAKALAEFAKEVPNSGGVAGWFAGENDLSKFAQELAAFGPGLKSYAESVKGLDTDVVVNSTNAAKALAEFAKEVPNSGGVAGWFAGENDLSDFAYELAAFGPGLKSYADSVSGLDSEVVVNSANAARALAEFAKEVPNSGGMVSWFTGDNDIGLFGENLAIFGDKFAAYAEYVKNVDPNVVTATASASQSLVELANQLPNSGGLISWFTGDNDIGAFGESLAAFGSAFGRYYDSVSGIDSSQLSDVIAETQKLVNLCIGLENVNTENMSAFGQNLTEMGKAGVDGFVQAFTNAKTKVKNTASDMLKNFIEGVKVKQSSVISVFTSLVQTAVNALKNTQQSAFRGVGQVLATAMIVGVQDKSASLVSAFTRIVGNAINAVGFQYNGFYNMGNYMVQGFADGIAAKQYLAEAKAKEMAAAAEAAAKAELDIHSPSKVFYSIGSFAGMGFIRALEDYSAMSYESGAKMANSAKSGLSRAISKITDTVNSNLDTQPTIRPVLDLSDVEAGASRLNAFFSERQAMIISDDLNNQSLHQNQNGINDTENDGITFIQNNYSPKPLSRLELFRQTRNQIYAAKGVRTR